MDSQHREACDACHYRKVRCSSATGGMGACLNCQRHGRQCVFSPRKEMGRPRKSKRSCSQVDVDEVSSIEVHQLPELVHHPQSDDGGPLLPLEPALHPPGNDPACWPSDGSQLSSDQLVPLQTLFPAEAASTSDPHFGPPLSNRRVPSPMVEGHIGGGSYSQDTFPIEVEALCAMGPREPLQGPENVGHQQSAVTDSRLEVYDRLSPLLFQLTRDSQALKRVKPCSGAELESVFFSVSALCDIIHTIALSEQGLGLQSCGFYSFQSRNETVVLALTAVLIVLEIYELLAQNAINDMPLLKQTKSGEREVLPIFSSGQQYPSSHASPGRGLHTYGRLDTVVRYTVMDFHLGQLRRLLEFNMKGSTSWQPNAIYHLESTRGRLDALRMWIQDLVSQA